MRTELPAERLQRRLSAQPSADDDDADDPNSLLPRWVPDAAKDDGWLAKVRADPGRAGAVALAVVAAIAVLVTIFTLMREQPAPVSSAKLPPVDMAATASRTPSSAARANQPVVVSVVGLVHTPGLVTLAPGARIADALKAAGGTTDGADTIGLNMARQVDDGEQIVVGIAPAKGQPAVLGSSVSPGSAAPGPTSSASRPAKGDSAQVVNLNTATVQQLDTLPGVGPVRAAAIVAWRQAHGKFSSVDQLGEVEGFGAARLEKLRPLVRV
ncbi:helix-hairpin-helix domain-containing protein [Candidatus Mycobacterium wuenschmannii]|uniref:Helix-hairpin-helix domain-containing protein n=1 Tax=Candidatus Mycobacterium wuenschmannii TaxID=3027808 RepID=A0ABY8W4T5_9MYCO|nr:helix-hairpin-helix domain-containing protein [Candidatus Mycobacterium wuenschmannii]WIM89438.1 helix-hairpin-helix domain-containing protein [Candidatus Mycobacterium wuenschmannii]